MINHRTMILLLVAGITLGACTSGDDADETPDTVWARIESEGKMVVGTAANYPPFAFYDDDLEMTGFDVDLMRAVGEALEVDVEFQNLAFDGLGEALQVGQIDAAIGAITITPEREAVVDFSYPYHVGANAALVLEGTPIDSLAVLDEGSDFSVGVERGSVFESWLRDTVVAGGRMPQANLFVYGDIAHAVRDLREGRVDIVVLDAEPAQLAVEQGGVTAIDPELPDQHYGIAVQDGTAELLGRINDTLLQLADAGVVDELALKHLGVEGYEIEAVPPAEPAESDAPECVSSMELLEHVTHDHADLGAPPLLQPGDELRKVWRVENTGTCTWGPGYTVSYADGNVPFAEMGGTPVAIDTEVVPGASYDIGVDLVAPILPGTYVGYWTMSDPSDEPFGEMLTVAVEVPVKPTVTPPPTVPPDPSITFTADPTSITAGERVKFAWDVKDAAAVYFHAEGRSWHQYQVPHQDSRAVWPNRTTAYFLRVERADGAFETRQITIVVAPVSQAPQITYFSVYPESRLPMGGCASIQWSVQGDASKVTVSANGAPLWDAAPLQGAVPHCPPGVGTMVYTIEATGSGGTSSLSHQLEVVPPSDGAPTPIPDGPVIAAFSASPSRIPAGACVRIYWQVAGTYQYITISRNDRVILDNAGPAGETTDCPGTTGSLAYRLKVTDSAGRAAQSESTVLVE